LNKIVETGMKIDLHIHSKVSSAKDGKKVSNNTIQNVPLLIEKLNENEVNICAITDHDKFSYEMYTSLKQAESNETSIQKVLPGVEFTVSFEHEEMNKTIHIVTIFSDDKDDKVKNIENILKKNRPNSDGAYTEEKFLEMLRLIDIDTILIAHQKNSLTSRKTRQNDANSLGNKKFLEFVYTDYFEAFEFKNKRNELLNKAYLIQNELEDKLRFVTGTDCHDWRVYPAEEPSEMIANFPFTYAKCLPTFKGLVMAMTDYTRLKTVNSFFNNADKHYVEKIEIETNGSRVQIPMSKGINVIIGDNSIGKSLLLHGITNFGKSGAMKLPSKIEKGYRKYLKDNNLKICSRIGDDKIFCFDMQGEVRAKFEENKLNATEFLGQYFPPDVDGKPYISKVNNEINRMTSYLEKKFKYDALVEKLKNFSIITTDSNAESLTFLKNLRVIKPKSKLIEEIVTEIENVIVSLEQLFTLSKNLDDDDLKFVKVSIAKYKEMKQKYERKIVLINQERERIEKIANVIDKLAEKHRKSITDQQKQNSTFAENTSLLKTQLIEVMKMREELLEYEPCLESTKIAPNSNRIHDYDFISKLNINEIDTNYFNECIRKVIKAKKSIHWKSITESELKDILLRYDEGTEVIQFLKNSLSNIIAEDFKPKNTIIYKGTDKYAEMSSGLDAKIYFDILSYETSRDGIYIIDQPEDNISQNAIKTYLLDRFKVMGENRQIIMVTHNPQFIVNLDVDNLIFMAKRNDEIQIQSGALEYVCDDYNVLDIVANNIDGGLDTIKKRWKRYEKVSEI